MSGRTLEIETPAAYLPFLDKWEEYSPAGRFLGAKGGRGGAKSHFFAGLVVDEMLSQHTRAACVREVQNSIKDSVKQLLEDKIRDYGVGHRFKITDREIVGPHESLAIFRGLQNHTAASIKSLEGFNLPWYEEAQTLSQRSLDLAIPTFRKPGSRQLFSWNPDQPDDPVDKMFRENAGDPDFVCIEVNYPDNPWFPDDLRKDMERDKRRDPLKYDHIWMGGYRQNADAQVFRNWKVERFEPPAGVTKFYAGADWGMSVDPTVLVICYIVGRTLYLWREVYKIGLSLDRTPAFFDTIDPQWTPARARDPNWKSLARRIPIIADSSHPHVIDYMQRIAGFSRMQAAIKGPGSVEDGVQFLQSYDIVIHPDCPNVAREMRLYSFKTDKKTGKVLSEFADKDNHTIDSVRYALENVRRGGSSSVEPLGI